MGWLAFAVFILACAIGTGLTNIANALHEGVTINIGKITIRDEQTADIYKKDQTVIRQSH